jgi:hypothetical protein
VSAVAGSLLATGGVMAVFMTDNQAGSVALLLISAVFMIMSINGAPLLGIRYSDNEIRLGSRGRRVLANVIKEPPEIARQTLDALVNYDPRIRDDPMAHANLQLVFPRAGITQIDFDNEWADLAIAVPENGRISSMQVVEIALKYTYNDVALSTASLRDFAEYRTGRTVPTVLVTNYRIPAELERRRRELRYEYGEDVVIIRWVDPEDNQALKEAIEPLLSTS